MARKIFANGVDYSTGKPLISPTTEDDFGKKVQDYFERNSQEIWYAKNLTRTMPRKPLDFGDPRSVGWTFLVSENDPKSSEIVKIMKPLAKLRGMENIDSHLLLGDAPPDKWDKWLSQNYDVEYSGRVPHYVLLVGSPKYIPFKFQSLFDLVASVGRLDSESMDDLQTYVDKIIRFEGPNAPNVRKEAKVFAPDGAGWDNCLYASCYRMAEPIADYIKELGFNVTRKLGNDASKQNLIGLLGDTSPALIFTASHGAGVTDKPLDVQKKVNGAICCQRSNEDAGKDYFTADDVPPYDVSFLEGSVFFQFACFGYGTPAQSDFSHWVQQSEVSKVNSEADFIAALPKKLLAHPRGPVLYIGHVDRAWVEGIDDQDIATEKQWNPRIAPFLHAINTLLRDGNPAGQAMESMNMRWARCDARITFELDRMQRNRTAEFKEIVNQFILRSDAQNYMIYGDPAASLKIES